MKRSTFTTALLAMALGVPSVGALAQPRDRDGDRDDRGRRGDRDDRRGPGRHDDRHHGKPSRHPHGGPPGHAYGGPPGHWKNATACRPPTAPATTWSTTGVATACSGRRAATTGCRWAPNTC